MRNMLEFSFFASLAVINHITSGVNRINIMTGARRVDVVKERARY